MTLRSDETLIQCQRGDRFHIDAIAEPIKIRTLIDGEIVNESTIKKGVIRIKEADAIQLIGEPGNVYSVHEDLLVNRKEHPDSQPIEVSVHPQPPTAREELNMLMQEMMLRKSESGQETPEEEMDFNVGEDQELFTPYEMVDMIEEVALESGYTQAELDAPQPPDVPESEIPPPEGEVAPAEESPPPA